ncbi:Ankyrin repeat domain-containing protein 40 [Chytriomyces hyalinus]|nr:Ankyrin repeat domain-containing protein 40 [Chytriomyces hyalinus]
MEFLQTCGGGNLAAVEQFLPVDAQKRDAVVNYAHPMNGWTGLMWAVKRNHVDVAHLLIKNGARIDAVSSKGDTAASLCSSEEMRAVLNVDTQIKPTDKSRDGFVPNYLVDVSALPPLDQVMAGVDKDTTHEVKHVNPAVPQSNVHVPAIVAPPVSVFAPQQNTSQVQPAQFNMPAEMREIRVQVIGQIDWFAGAVFVRATDTIEELVRVIQSELDDIPPVFKLIRVDPEAQPQSIIISKKQFHHPVGLHFAKGNFLRLKPEPK